MTLLLAAVPALAVLTAWRPGALSSACIETGAFLLALLCLGLAWRKGSTPRITALFLSVAALPAIGCLQLLLLRVAYPFATKKAVLYWAAAAALVLAAEWLLRARSARSLLLSCVVWLGVAATIIEVVQIYHFHRYEVMSTGYPLLSSNYYAELIELILPIVLVRAFRGQRLWWAHLLLAALFVSTVIAAAARVGAVLALIECIAVAAIHYKAYGPRPGRWHKTCVILVLLAAALVVLQEPLTLIHRLREGDLAAGRSDITRSAVAMVRARPLTGFGLGGFPAAYPAFARFDNGYLVNHAHNDWLEALVDGGPAFFVAFAAFVLISAWQGVRAIWGMGLAILPLHALTDFPMQRPGVALLFAVLASAAAARESRRKQQVADPPYFRFQKMT